ncbi:MAG TPA: amino acid adenylation domain-containing protein, partial [Acidimicrobiales bacterium]|nr:amino acid adenylation domain-containing protein [Acidimicrobiales bacterium]
MEEPGAQASTADAGDAASGDDLASPGAQASTADAGDAASGDDLAYVLYTSGSTGTPKGVPVRHSALVNLLSSFAREPGLTAGSTVLAAISFGFDLAALDIWLPLTLGARVVVAPDAAVADGARLAGMIERAGVTFLQATPTTWQLLLEAGWAGKQDLVAVSGGEPLSASLADAISSCCAQLWNGYGPTESTVSATLERVTGGERVTIGRPIANTKVYVLDRLGEPVPVGVPGELYIAGAGVAAGYLNRPEETTARFSDDPFNRGGRMYRTGDLVRQLADGRLQHLGRLDDQVKLRGYRIELGEIESALRSHPSVASAAVALTADSSPAGARLVAYVVPNGPMPQHSDLRRQLRSSLPEYMVPSTFVALEGLPRTPNGKLDRRRLPAPPAPRLSSGTGRSSAEDPDASLTPLQDQLLGMWREALGVENLGVDDDFFEFGGHSLLAARLVAEAGSRLEMEIPLSFLYERGATVRAMAAAIESAEREGDGTSTPGRLQLSPVRRRLGEAPAGVSLAQEQLWYFSRLAPESPVYNESVTIVKDGQFDHQAFVRAFNEIVRRHEAWRTTFVVVDGEPVQCVGDPATIDLPVHDLSGRPRAEAEHEAAVLAHADAVAPYDLAAGPLIRPRLVRFADDHHRLYLGLHHLVFDGGSLYRIILPELVALYDAFAAGRASPLPEPVIRYSDYAEWEREWMAGPVAAARLDYWRDRLAGVPTLELPLDRPRPLTQRFQGRVESFSVPVETVEGLRSLATSLRVTLFQVLAACYAVLLHRYSGQDEVVFGTPSDLRQRSELQSVVGMCLTPIVLRCNLADDPSFVDLVGQMSTEVIEALENVVPFPAVVRAVHPERDLQMNPLFQALFALQQETFPPDPSWTIHEMDIPIETAKFDLSIELDDQPGGHFDGRIIVNADVFEPDTALRMVGHLLTLFGSVAADPHRPVSRLQLLTADELHRQLVEWNGTEADVPAAATVPELVSRQVQRSPDAVALEYEGLRLSYRELEAAANGVAARLRAAGVMRGDVVALHCHRGLEAPIGMLGILKAGGAYLPLDPALPTSRLAFMLGDAEATVLLVEPGLLGAVSEWRPDGVAVLRLDLPGAGDPYAEMEEPGAQASTADAGGAASGDDLAYVLYTSGSTGTPKGVPVRHSA